MSPLPAWFRIDDYPDEALPPIPNFPDWAVDKDDHRMCEAAWKLAAQAGRADPPFLMEQLIIGYPKAARLSMWITGDGRAR